MFGCVVAGRPVQTNIQAIDDHQFVFVIPSVRSVNHLVVFLLPDTVLPPIYAATVHARFPGGQNFQLLGAISAKKPSAIFRVKGGLGADADDMVDATNDDGGLGDLTLGISVEPAEAVEQQLAALAATNTTTTAANTKDANVVAGSLVKHKPPPNTLFLARKIIENAFNFLGSFAQGGGGVRSGSLEEVVPLKAFRDWWVKFEKKVEYDPSFLERSDS